MVEMVKYLTGDTTIEDFVMADKGFNALFVDDVRDMPEDCEQYTWTIARTAWEALIKLELIEFEVLSLDHDLASFVGNKELTGADIAVWLAKRSHDGKYVPPDIRIHSANPVGAKNIDEIVRRYLTKKV